MKRQRPKTKEERAEAREHAKFMRFIDRCAREVAKWPAWMKGRAS